MKNKIAIFQRRREDKQLLKERQQTYVDYVCEQTGWSDAEARKRMDALKSKGVNYRYYVKRRLWTKEDRALEKSIASIVKVRENEKKRRKAYIELVCQETGWTPRQAEKHILEASLYSGCTFRDYYCFRFWEKSKEEQMQYYTKGVLEQLQMKYNTDAEDVSVLRWKRRFAEKYEDLLHRVWFRNRELSLREFLEKIEGIHELVTVSTSGSHEAECRFYPIDDTPEGRKELYTTIMRKKPKHCEEWIHQHHELAAFCDLSVNTVRLVTILDKDVCYPAYGVLRIGSGLEYGYDAGGYYVPIDMETGKTCMDGFDKEMNRIAFHPVSEKPFNDFQIPNWDKVLTLAEEAARRLEGIHLVEWTIAVTEDGACLIEGTSEPNHHYAQLPYVESGIGVKGKLEPFLT